MAAIVADVQMKTAILPIPGDAITKVKITEINKYFPKGYVMKKVLDF